MTVSANDFPALAEVDAERFRQLIHDLRTPLSIICMGLDALKHVRHDDEQFAQILKMISSEGTGPLKEFIAGLAERLPHDPALPPPT